MRLALLSLLALAACDRGAEAPSSEENRRMNEADAMLNDAPGQLDSIDDSAVLVNETAAPNASEEAPEAAVN